MVDKYVQIVVDTNDGDYDSDIRLVGEETIERLRNIFIKLSTKVDHNGKLRWGTYEMKTEDNDPKNYLDVITEDDIEFVEDLAPYCEYGFHTISAVDLFENKTTIF